MDHHNNESVKEIYHFQDRNISTVNIYLHMSASNSKNLINKSKYLCLSFWSICLILLKHQDSIKLKDMRGSFKVKETNIKANNFAVSAGF